MNRTPAQASKTSTEHPANAAPSPSVAPNPSSAKRAAAPTRRALLASALLASTLLLFLAVTLPARAAEPLRIAAAADLQPVLPAILADFIRSTGISAEASYQSSATLATQIENGAGFDLFLAADTSFPKRLIAAGLAEQAEPIIYARGTLVLWARKDAPLLVASNKPLTLEILRNPGLRSLAVANPEHAPYGRAARAALTSLGLLTTLTPKLVTAENHRPNRPVRLHRQCRARPHLLTSALTPDLRAKGEYVEVPSTAYPPILQGAVTLKRSAVLPQAHRLLDFLATPPSGKLWLRAAWRPRGKVPMLPIAAPTTILGLTGALLAVSAPAAPPLAAWTPTLSLLKTAHLAISPRALAALPIPNAPARPIPHLLWPSAPPCLHLLPTWQIDTQALLLTVELATVTTLILIAVACPLAGWLTLSRARLRPMVESLAMLPLVMPPTVLGFYLLVLLGPHTGVGRWLARILGHPLAFSFAGLVVGSVLYSLPFALQPLTAGFAQVPSALLEASALLGASRLRTLYAVVLPLARRSLLASAILSFTHTIGEFGVVLMLGGDIPGRTRTLSIALLDQVQDARYAAANQTALLLLACSTLVLLLIYGNKPGAGFSPAPRPPTTTTDPGDLRG